MAELHYRLTLRDPCVLPRGDGDENTVDTWDRIPGGAVLGALAGRWLASHPGVDPARDPEFRRLFLGDGARFLHALPEGPSGSRLLPCPLSLRFPRGGAHGAAFVDLVQPPEDVDTAGWKGLDGAYVAWKDDTLRFHVPSVQDELHHARDRAAGRPTTQGGALFHYQSLEAGQRFAGVVEGLEDGDAAVLRALFEQGPLRLGRSRGAEYGGTAGVDLVDPTRPWAEFQPVEDSDDCPFLVATLLSEYLGRDADGEATPAAFDGDLARAAGGLPALRRQATFARHQALRGWVAAWGLPRPVHPAIAAGSVFVYEGVEPTVLRRLRGQVLRVGERQHEGFGRVALGWHGGPSRGDQFIAERLDAAARPPSGSPGSRVTARMWERWLLDAIPAHVASTLDRGPGGSRRWPAPSVLGALRDGIARLDDATEAAHVLADGRPQRGSRDQRGSAAPSPRRAGVPLSDDAGRDLRRLRLEVPRGEPAVLPLADLVGRTGPWVQPAPHPEDRGSLRGFAYVERALAGSGRERVPDGLGFLRDGAVSLDDAAQRRVCRAWLDCLLGAARREAAASRDGGGPR